MKFEYFKIKSKRQPNGVFGTPLAVLYMESTPPPGREELHSAIIVAMNERYPHVNMSIENWYSKDVGFMVKFDKNVYKDNRVFRDRYPVIYDQYHLEGNRLYYFYSQEERKLFFLKKKIKKLNKIGNK